MKATAYHEAGHAVGYAALGRDFTEVTIERAAHALGMVSEPSRQRIPGIPDDHDIRASLMGPAAQRIAMGRWDWTGAAHDLAHVCRRLAEARAEAPPELASLWSRETLSGAIRHKATDAIRECGACWPAIDEVARALIDRRRLGFDEVAEVVGAVPEGKQVERPRLARSLRLQLTINFEAFASLPEPG